MSGIGKSTWFTTDANDAMRTFHYRMPVMLAPEAFEPWLAGEPIGLGPAPEDPLSIHRVNRHLNNRRDNDSDYVGALEV